MIERYKLNNKGIDSAAKKAEEYLTEMKIPHKDVLRVRLGVEETLIRYRQQYGEDVDFEIKGSRRFRRTNISLFIEGRMWDPFARNGSVEQSSAIMRTAMTNMGELPVWRYTRGENVITYSFRKKELDSWAQLLIAIGAAIIAALLLKLLPESALSVFRNDILTPLLDTFMNLLSAIAGPMIFLAVVWGIYSIGDVSAFSVMGKKLIERLMIFCAVFTAIGGVLSIPFFSFITGEQQAGNGFSDIFRMVLDIIPGNIIRPFAEGNTLQILFIAIVMGIAMIIIGEKTQTVAVFAEQLNYIVQLIMEFISKLVPFFVFGSLLNIILNNQFEDIKVSYKLFLVNLGACLAFTLAYVVIICLRYRVSPLVFIKKALKPFIICLTTASSSAAFSTSLSTCSEEFGINADFANFGVPFAQVLYKPTVAILYFSSAFYVAELSGTAVSVEWFITALFASIVLSVATPPIPGGTLASISVLFAQLSLPPEGMAMVLALNIVLDFIETPVDVFGGHVLLIQSADRFGLLDKFILRKGTEKKKNL